MRMVSHPSPPAPSVGPTHRGRRRRSHDQHRAPRSPASGPTCSRRCGGTGTSCASPSGPHRRAGAATADGQRADLGGLIKHVAGTEAAWMRFAEGGAEAMRRNWGPDDLLPALAPRARRDPGRRAGRVRGGRPATDELVATVPDLDARTRCPRRPGSSRAPTGRCGGWCCTSSPRPRSTPATPTSSGSRSTVRRRWADALGVRSRLTGRMLPLAELHLHIEGTFEADLLVRLAAATAYRCRATTRRS